jgi:hypothetical protein
MVEVPTSLGQVDAAWMTAALRDAGHDAPDITALKFEPVGGNVGVLGEVGVFTVSYAAATDLPEKYLGKCPLDEDMARLYNSIMRYYGRETGFYRDLADAVPMRVPRCWVNLSDDADHHLLLLEYFADATPGDVLEGTTLDKMKRLVGDMAAMHGRYWMDESTRALPWMFTFNESSLPMAWDVVAETWPLAMGVEPGFVPKDLAQLVEGSYLSDVPREKWLAAYDARPWTLIHGDYELENVLFDGDEVVIIDWQGVMVGFPAMDLGFTLSVSGSDETIAGERELLDHYRDVLATSGGPSWSHEELMDDLAWSMLFFVVGQTVPFVQDYSALGSQGERTKQRMVMSWRRCVDAAMRWQTAARVTPPA